MKTVSVLFVFLLVLTAQMYSQNEYALYEKIAAKRMTNLLYQSDYSLKGNRMVLVDTLVYVFNNDYKITSLKDGNSTGFPMKEFFYNDEKKLSKIQHNAKGIIFSETFSYQLGKLVSMKRLDNENTVANSVGFNYDKFGRIEKKTSSTGNYVSKYFYYDSNLVKVEVSNTSKVKKVIEYAYDIDGRMISERIYESYKKGKVGKRYLKLKIDFKYDDYGNLIEKIYYPSENSKERIAYSYDELGNLFEWSKFDTAGQVVYLSRISYN